MVAYVGDDLRGFGDLLLLKHENGWVTAYAHAETFTVAVGDTVNRGDAIGQVGKSGAVDSPQLHFELRRGTQAIDPAHTFAALKFFRRGKDAPCGLHNRARTARQPAPINLRADAKTFRLRF